MLCSCLELLRLVLTTLHFGPTNTVSVRNLMPSISQIVHSAWDRRSRVAQLPARVDVSSTTNIGDEEKIDKIVCPNNWRCEYAR